MKPNIKILLKAIGIAILILGFAGGFVFGLYGLGKIWFCIGLLLIPVCALVFSVYQYLKYKQ